MGITITLDEKTNVNVAHLTVVRIFFQAKFDKELVVCWEIVNYRNRLRLVLRCPSVYSKFFFIKLNIESGMVFG